MATSVALDTSPSTILRSLHGRIVDARIAYPEVLHVEVRDEAGELWRFATQDAEFRPADPASLVGQVLEEAKVDPTTVELRCRLSDGSQLVVVPAVEEAADDPPNWELITPDHLTLEFGPGLRWQIGSADARVSSP
jgi:hypothetical protein